MYDYDRGRPIQPQDVYENVNIPDKRIEFQMYPASTEHGCLVTRYWDEPGLYTLMRIQTKEKGRFLHDRFAFYTCVKGQGSINGVPIRQGETILVPHNMGWLEIESELDVFLASYRNERL